jgi:hypothetical protein
MVFGPLYIPLQISHHAYFRSKKYLLYKLLFEIRLIIISMIYSQRIFIPVHFIALPVRISSINVILPPGRWVPGT